MEKKSMTGLLLEVHLVFRGSKGEGEEENGPEWQKWE